MRPHIFASCRMRLLNSCTAEAISPCSHLMMTQWLPQHMASYHKWLHYLMHDRMCLQCCSRLQIPKGSVLYGNRVGRCWDFTAGDRAHALGFCLKKSLHDWSQVPMTVTRHQ